MVCERISQQIYKNLTGDEHMSICSQILSYNEQATNLATSHPNVLNVFSHTEA